jgi:hypothetical protein
VRLLLELTSRRSPFVPSPKKVLRAVLTSFIIPLSRVLFLSAFILKDPQPNLCLLSLLSHLKIAIPGPTKHDQADVLVRYMLDASRSAITNRSLSLLSRSTFRKQACPALQAMSRPYHFSNPNHSLLLFFQSCGRGTTGPSRRASGPRLTSSSPTSWTPSSPSCGRRPTQTR